MNIFEITFSPTGGTDKVADILAKEFASIDFSQAKSPAEIQKIDLTSRAADFGSITISPDDICIIAVPVYGGRVPAPATEHLSRIKGNQAKAILVAVYGNREFDDALVEIQDAAAAAGFLPLAGISAIAEHSILRQFAAGRPDEKDQAELKEFAAKIHEKLAQSEQESLIENAAETTALDLPGNRPYKERAVLPTMPIAGELCGRCGHCADVCPTGAIPKDQPDHTLNDLCISCMRCTFVCPKHARYVRPTVANVLNEKLSKVATQRKNNKLYI